MRPKAASGGPWGRPRCDPTRAGEGDRRPPNRLKRVWDPPRTRQSPRTLAAFLPWGGWRGKRRTEGRSPSLAAPGTARARWAQAIAQAPPWRSHGKSPVSYATEDSPSGRGRTLGKRVSGNASRVQIPHPPPGSACSVACGNLPGAGVGSHRGATPRTPRCGAAPREARRWRRLAAREAKRLAPVGGPRSEAVGAGWRPAKRSGWALGASLQSDMPRGGASRLHLA